MTKQGAAFVLRQVQASDARRLATRQTWHGRRYGGCNTAGPTSCSAVHDQPRSVPIEVDPADFDRVPTGTRDAAWHIDPVAALRPIVSPLGSIDLLALDLE